ncbi:divalent-cation tolerance protein CutA [soil metagenome]
MLITMTTVASEAEALRLARLIVEKKLAACVQILPKMTSVYVWKGEVQEEAEHLLLIKSLPEKYAEIERLLLAEHSYDTPEIVAISAEHAAAGYLDWVTETLR